MGEINYSIFYYCKIGYHDRCSIDLNRKEGYFRCTCNCHKDQLVNLENTESEDNTNT